ncbi:MAG: hypothetical protein HOM96_01545 [Rickettsiales bacterium]|jgi:ankyrin repeat protein|nr:hypothetical protein [Rickettsiales bacterium]
MFKNLYKSTLSITSLILLTSCMMITPPNDKLAKKLDQLSSGGDSNKVIAYLEKLDKDKITDTDGKLIRKAIDIDDITLIEKLLLQENININVKGTDQYTALGYLISIPAKNSKNQSDIAKLLIESGADVNTRIAKNETLLILSADQNLPEIIKLLIDNGADVNASSNNGETAIHKSKEDVLRILVENNADINIVDNQGNTVLHKLYYIEDIHFLSAQGLDINAVNNKGETVLFNACNNRNCNSVRIEKLIAAGANPNIKNKESITVAHLALKTLSIDTVKVLLDNEANINIADNTGKTPLHYLALSLHNINYSETIDIKQVYESAALLFAAGADPLAKDNEGNDPFAIAKDAISPMIESLQDMANAKNSNR